MTRRKKRVTNWRRLNALLQRLAARPDTRARLCQHTGSSAGCVYHGTWPDVRKIRVTVDIDRVGRVPGIVHELMHAYFDPMLTAVSADIREKMIRAVEEAFVNDYLDVDARRWRAWRKIRKSLLGP